MSTALIFCDAETYYDSKSYTLKKLSTQSYIKDPRFKCFGWGLAINKNPAIWVTGADQERYLQKVIPGNVVVGHNISGFDGAILNWVYGLKPLLFIDTLAMSRALIGERLRSHSLDSVSNFLFGFGKLPYLKEMDGVQNPNEQQLALLGQYCALDPHSDINLTRNIFYHLWPHFPRSELAVQDFVARCYTEPCLLLDPVLLKTYHAEVIAKKLRALDDAGIENVKDVRSDARLAEAFKTLGVEPPIKISPAWEKKTDEQKAATEDQKYKFAFAKTDEEFQALRNHSDERVQALVEARLENKTTIAETRAATYLTASSFGAWPVGYFYSGAMTTHRLSGTEGNPQNLPRKGVLRRAIMAPIRHTLVVGDLAQIELRLTLAMAVELLWLNNLNAGLSEEYRALQILASGGDLYCDFGEELYGRKITRADEEDRHIAKECVLGCGYQMGAPKLVKYLGGKGITVTPEFAERAIDVYRSRFRAVKGVWNYLRDKFKLAIFNDDQDYQLFKTPDIWLTHEPLYRDRAVKLPNGLYVKYPGLHMRPKSDDDFGGITYRRADGDSALFGGKILQNMIECLSRNIIFPQSVKVSKRYKVAMSTHDELVAVVPREEKEEGMAFVKATMEESLSWWPSLPLNAEVKSNDRYGNAK